MNIQLAPSTGGGQIVQLPRREAERAWFGPGLPDLDRALLNPASVFESPQDVVRHPLLSLDCKREILLRWAWDEYLVDLALADGMPEGEPSQLTEVRTALRILNIEWSPDPAAPAMSIPHFDQLCSLAA
jgi:hypothetical protein